MRKLLKGMLVTLSLLLLVGCDNPFNIVKLKEIRDEKTIVTDQPEEVSLKEGKYIQIAPSNVGSQGEGYDSYLTLENGIATKYDTYFEATTEGTYTINGKLLIIHYTRNYGMATYGEPYDDTIDRTFNAHIDGNKIIIDSMNDFDAYESGSIIYELIEQ